MAKTLFQTRTAWSRSRICFRKSTATTRRRCTNNHTILTSLRTTHTTSRMNQRLDNQQDNHGSGIVDSASIDPVYLYLADEDFPTQMPQQETFALEISIPGPSFQDNIDSGPSDIQIQTIVWDGALAEKPVQTTTFAHWGSTVSSGQRRRDQPRSNLQQRLRSESLHGRCFWIRVGRENTTNCQHTGPGHRQCLWSFLVIIAIYHAVCLTALGRISCFEIGTV